MADLGAQLLGFPPLQNFDGFRSQGDSTGTTSFGRAYIGSLLLRVQQSLLDHHDALVQIHTVPLQAHQLTTAAASIDEDIGHGPPLDGRFIQSLDDVRNLLRLEVVGFLTRSLGRCGLGSRIVFNASTCGDNCARYILKIARERDVTINLYHIMRFGKRFKVKVLNDGAVVDNMEQLILHAAKYL